MWQDLHNVNCQFQSVAALRSVLYHELEDDVPEQGEYNIGYFEGRQQKKKWLVTPADLEAMYSYYEEKAHIISLWCDGRNQSDHEVSSDDMKEKGHQNEQGRKRIYHKGE